ncbi:hypothetical protein HKD37_12G033597 [Glycine soja]
MRRQGHYGDPSANTCVGGSQMHHMAGQRGEAKSGNFEGRLEAFTPQRENPYANSKQEGQGQWRWEIDEAKMSNSMASRMFNEGNMEIFVSKLEVRGAISCSSVGQGVDASKSYFQGPSRNNSDSRSQAHGEDMDVGYEGNHLSQSFEGLEQNFHDDIIKLTKEQNDAEDAEYARHREKGAKRKKCIYAQFCSLVSSVRVKLASLRKNWVSLWHKTLWDLFNSLFVFEDVKDTFEAKINAINAQYEEKLAALRAQHSSRRAEFLQRESHARQQQYQQIIRDPYPSGGMAPGDPHGYNNVNASGTGEVQRGYSADHLDPYRERARFLGGGRDQGFEPRGEIAYIDIIYALSSFPSFYYTVHGNYCFLAVVIYIDQHWRCTPLHWCCALKRRTTRIFLVCVYENL